MSITEMIALLQNRYPCSDDTCDALVSVIEGPQADEIIEELSRLQGLEK